MAPKTLNVALYLRLSRDSEESTSIDTQREACKRWLAANGFEADAYTITEYVDTGVSGAKPLEQRKGMRVLMAARPDIVVAWKLDRYARSVSEFLRLVAWGEAHGLRIATSDNTINTTTPTGRMVAVVLAALAEWERSLIINRVTDAHETRRKQGRWSSGFAPYGYRIVRRDGGAYLAVDDEQAAKVQEAVTALLDEGTATSTAPIVGLGHIRWRRLLKSPVLRGQRMYKGALVCEEDGITPVQFAEPIISAAQHKAIRARLLELGTGDQRAPRAASPLCHGYAWCYKGCKLNGGASGRGVRLYKCQQGHVTINADTLDEAVTANFLVRWGSMAEHVVRLEGGNDLSDQMIEAQEQAERLTAKMASAGPLMLASLEKHAADLEAAYAALKAAHDPEVREVLEPTGRTLREAWEASERDRRRLLGDIGLHVVLHPRQQAERLEINWASGGDDHELVDMLGEMEAAK
ncbi:recombinase family protein [Streptomyces chartreusis]|uniref:recombinase family protein n=1 Tax=Streptomyces chartreusis TaxID=1969 RepID=UPI003D8A2DC9